MEQVKSLLKREVLEKTYIEFKGYSLLTEAENSSWWKGYAEYYGFFIDQELCMVMIGFTIDHEFYLKALGRVQGTKETHLTKRFFDLFKETEKVRIINFVPHYLLESYYKQIGATEFTNLIY